ncbi:MAG: DNA-3-methyladenine glycosylase I [Pseudomonadota bacterium]
MPKRCPWAEKHELETEYHDTEWGVPEHNDQKLFELLSLESAQSGLSWLTILQKRDGYREAFVEFEIAKVARYSAKKRAVLLKNPAIVRHKLKIDAVVENAKRILDIQQSQGSFAAYVWDFVDGATVQNNWRTGAEVPSKTGVSDALSKDLKKRGFKFVGSTTCYSFMQASGMVNDHLVSCFRYKAVQSE